MSPPTDESRPRPGSGDSSSSSSTKCKASRRQDSAAARRLDAALRLPGLEDGTRDPSVSWDALPAPGELVIEVGPRHTAWLTGPSKVIVPLLAMLGTRWQYGPDGWAFPRKYVDDVLAAADLERRPIRLRSVER
jgi:hypothetical protein